MARAQRYLAIYLALVLALVASRYLTRDTYPALRALRDQEAALVQRRASLNLDVARLESPARVRAWAEQNQMVPWSKAPRDFAALGELPDPPSSPPATGTVEMRTRWR